MSQVIIAFDLSAYTRDDVLIRFVEVRISRAVKCFTGPGCAGNARFRNQVFVLPAHNAFNFIMRPFTHPLDLWLNGCAAGLLYYVRQLMGQQSLTRR